MKNWLNNTVLTVFSKSDTCWHSLSNKKQCFFNGFGTCFSGRFTNRCFYNEFCIESDPSNSKTYLFSKTVFFTMNSARLFKNTSFYNNKCTISPVGWLAGWLAGRLAGRLAGLLACEPRRNTFLHRKLRRNTFLHRASSMVPERTQMNAQLFLIDFLNLGFAFIIYVFYNVFEHNRLKA